MKKRHFLFIFCVFALSLSAAPKEYTARDGHSLRGFGMPAYQISVSAEYAYNRTWEHFANFNVQALMPVNQYFELQTNLRFSTANVYTGALILRPKFALPVGELFLETELLYKALARNRLSDFCAALSVGYRMDYVSFNIGMYGRVMDTWDREWHSEAIYNCEPFNILYRLEVFCRPQMSKWNISACFSNIDDYQMERTWQPLFMLGGHYDINQHWRVAFSGECKPTGMFHLNATIYSVYARAGFTYTF